MGVNIIQGVQSIIDFADYNAARSATQYYANSASAYSGMLENSYSSGSSALVRGVIDGGGGKTYGKIIDFQPNLQGGTETGVSVASATATGAGTEVAVTSGEATLTAVPLIEALGGILAGLGVGILSYEANKDFWIDISNNLFLNVPGYEPITYDNIEDMSLLTLFKDGKTYVDAELVQKINNYLIEIGAFNGTTIVEIDVPETAGTYILNSGAVSSSNISALFNKMLGFTHVNTQPLLYAFSRVMEHLAPSISSGTYNSFAIQLTTNYDSTAERAYVDLYLFNETLPLNRNISDADIFTVDNNRFAYMGNKQSTLHGYGGCIMVNHEIDNIGAYTATNTSVQRYIGVNNQNPNTINSSSFNNNYVVTPSIEELPALQPRTISTTPDSIPTEMPDWWQNILEIGSIDPVTKELTLPKFLPVGVPSTSPVTNPVTTPQPDIQTGNVPATNPKPVGDSVLPIMTPTGQPFSSPAEPTPTPTPTPAIPVIPAIGGQANKLFTVYNPSQANLNALGATLWTQNIITQIVQMFTNNPMDAIISLHILYATPTTGADKEIKLGYVPTGVSCPEVTNQYVNVDCGTVRIPELFGDARDYANTDISIYLPMIGFRQLKTEDAMASNVSVDYKVDVFTGTVLATVTINKGSVNQVFYTYEGNCAVNLPLTGADKSRQMATAVGAVGAMVTGNPLMGLGSATAIAGGSARAQIQRSGNFTGNAGAMGCKKPYIIVSSDVPYDAAGYQTQYGYPANLTVMLGDCSGYVKVKEVHADAISNATEQEKRDIENQLKQGIIIH